MTQSNSRQAGHPIARIFLDRWSPRAFNGEDIPVEVLDAFFEAARWAPSSFNSQPWRFLYARRGTPNWDLFLGLLNEFNQTWARTASALIFVISHSSQRMPGSDSEAALYSHSFDAGAAWANLALQAAMSGWATHCMTGFDVDRAACALNAPAGHRVEAVIAVGRRGDPAQLPERLAARERPSDRLPLEEIRFEGPLPATS
jgi:nitroreductase